MTSTETFPTEDQGLEDSSLYNADLAPVPAARRTWTLWNYAALWISMSACIPTYMLASSLIGGGMNWSQAVGTIFLGNLIVLLPMILNAHAGTRYGIPFPVYCRAAFGTSAQTFPRCSAPWSRAVGSASRPGSAATPSSKSSACFFRRWPMPTSPPRSESPSHNSSASCSSGPSTCGSFSGASTPSGCCSPSRLPS